MTVRPVLGLIAAATLLGACTSTRTPTATTTAVPLSLALSTNSSHATIDGTGAQTAQAATGGTVTISSAGVMTLTGITNAGATAFPATFSATRSASDTSAAGGRTYTTENFVRTAGTVTDAAALIRNDLGTAFAGFASRNDTAGGDANVVLFHGGTTATNVPTTGNLNFTGRASGTAQNSAVLAGASQNVRGDALIVANMNTNSVSGTISNIRSTGGTDMDMRVNWTGATLTGGTVFSGTTVVVQDGAGGTLGGQAGGNRVSGQIYGTGASAGLGGTAVAGAVNAANDVGGVQRGFIGGFLGQR